MGLGFLWKELDPDELQGMKSGKRTIGSLSKNLIDEQDLKRLR
jgi:hypothetical protein